MNGMWDVSNKEWTPRTAVARAVLVAKESTIDALTRGELPKGDPIPVARVAAIQAAKNTPQIIPYCHPIPIDKVSVEFTVGTDRIEIRTEVKSTYKTGVEMEALTAAATAALTLYDMLKMLDMGMRITSLELVEKRGGKSDFLASKENE